MQRLRSGAVNAEDILAAGRRLFSAPDQALRDWRWMFDEPEPRVLDVASIPLASANVAGRLWVFDDITPQYRAASELKTLNEELSRGLSRLDLAMDVADIGIWSWDLATDTVTWDESLRRW